MTAMHVEDFDAKLIDMRHFYITALGLLLSLN